MSRLRQPRAHVAAGTVLAVVALALGLAVASSPRTGVVVLALALGLATLLRVLLPPDWVGLLGVRSRRRDAATLLLLTVTLATLAAVMPTPTGP